jgi:hypothetical protein
MTRKPIGVLEAMGSRFLDFAQQTPVKRPEKLDSRAGFHPPVALFVSLSVRYLRELIENVLTWSLLFFRGLVMSTTSRDDLMGLLRRIQAGDADAEQLLVALLYQDLRGIAARRMRMEGNGTCSSHICPGPPASAARLRIRVLDNIMKIFISYRRDDSADITGRAYDRLKSAFGPEKVILDVATIPRGVDYRKHIVESISSCDVLLAVIGSRWLTTHSGGDLPAGKRLAIRCV